jgi:hypothetical protein
MLLHAWTVQLGRLLLCDEAVEDESCDAANLNVMMQQCGGKTDKFGFHGSSVGSKAAFLSQLAAHPIVRKKIVLTRARLDIEWTGLLRSGAGAVPGVHPGTTQRQKGPNFCHHHRSVNLLEFRRASFREKLIESWFRNQPLNQTNDPNHGDVPKLDASTIGV